MSLTSQRRDLVVRIDAETKGFEGGLQKSSAELRKMQAELKKLDAAAAQRNQAMSQVGKVAAGAGIAIAAGMYAAGKSFADFDSAMSGVEAATHASAAAMGDLREAALDAGARTVFSASEAADAIEQLAKAGVSTEAILNGGLNGALDLAAAGSLAVGEAAEIAATAMTQFKLDGSAIPHVADLLAASAGKAQGEVTDMGQALKQAGLVAAGTGLSIEETTAGLAAFASAGLIGSDAGTSFKTMLQRLVPQSDKAAELGDLGFSAYDAQGNFIGLEAVAGELQTALAGMTAEQRDATFATLFGSDAVRAARVLYDQGAEGIAEWTEKVNDAGYAQETAAIKLDNLKGDIEAFMGSVETALIKTGESGDGLARGLVQNATDVVNSYSEMDGAARTAMTAATGTIGTIALLGGGFLLLAPRIAETRKAMSELGTDMPRTTRAMTGLAKALGGLAAFGTVSMVLDGIITSTQGTAIGVEQMTNRILASLGDVDAAFAEMDLWQESAGSLEEALQILADPGLANRLGDLGGEILTFGGNEGSYRRTAIIEQLETMGTALAQLGSSGKGDLAAAKFREFADAADAAGMSSEDLLDLMPAYAEYLASVENEATLAAGAQSEMGGAISDATGEVEEQTDSLADLLEKVREMSDLVLGLRDSSRGYEEAVAAATAAVKENGRVHGIASEAGRKNEEALDGIATAAADVLEAMVANGRPLDEITAKFGTQREALIKAATQFGYTRAEAETYADMVLQIPAEASTTVKTPGAQEAKDNITTLRRLAKSLDEVTVEVPVRLTGVGAFLGELSRAKSAANVKPAQPVNPLTPPGLFPVKKAAGGFVSGPGTGTSDDIPAMLSNGEYVIRASSVQRIGVTALDQLNGYAAGGLVGPVAQPVGGSGGGALRLHPDDLKVLAGAARGDINLTVHEAAASAVDIVEEATFAARLGRL